MGYVLLVLILIISLVVPFIVVSGIIIVVLVPSACILRNRYRLATPRLRRGEKL